MKQKDFAIAIATKGRAYTSTTLQMVKNLPHDIAVWVYVDENEVPVYKEAFPNFNIMHHNKKSIMEIRALIQEHQHGLDNNFLMLDDDIQWFGYLLKDNHEEWFDRAVIGLVNNARQLFSEGRDFIYALEMGDKDYYVPLCVDNTVINDAVKYWRPMAMGCVGMSPRLYDTGIRYQDTDIVSEDIYITIEAYIAEAKGKIKTGLLDSCFRFCTDTNVIQSHFRSSLYYEAVYRAYRTYGYVFDFIMHDNMKVPLSRINLEGVKHFVANGKTSHPYYDALCAKALEVKATGYKALEGWEPAIGYDKKTLRKIGKRKLFFALHAGPLFEHEFVTDYLIALNMRGQVFADTPEQITPANYKCLKLCQDKTGKIFDRFDEEGKPVKLPSFEMECDLNEEN